MNKLQVLIEDEWKYVFCRNERKATPITTEDRSNAIRGTNDSLTYFSNNFGSCEFRITTIEGGNNNGIRSR